MAPAPESQAVPMASTRQSLTGLISTTIALSFGISMAAAAMLLGAAVWLERF